MIRFGTKAVVRLYFGAIEIATGWLGDIKVFVIFEGSGGSPPASVPTYYILGF